jgi:hypothetical protein
MVSISLYSKYILWLMYTYDSYTLYIYYLFFFKYIYFIKYTYTFIYIYIYIYIYILLYFISSLHLHFFILLLSIVVRKHCILLFFSVCIVLVWIQKIDPIFVGTRCTTKTNNVKNIYSRKYDGLLSRNIALCHTKMCAVSRVFVVFC